MILFLDFDGVLHPDAAYCERGRPVLRAEGALFMWAPILVDIVAPFPALRIVLSTSWVRVLRFDRARSYLPRELQRRVIGATWHSAMARHPEGSHRINDWYATATRYQQIVRYVERSGAAASEWLAIDDDDDGWEDVNRFRLIPTDGRFGLSVLKTQHELRSKLERLHGACGNPGVCGDPTTSLDRE
ncbi:HAD domain-containing protein [Ralstonia pseudosolanacearum]